MYYRLYVGIRLRGHDVFLVIFHFKLVYMKVFIIFIFYYFHIQPLWSHIVSDMTNVGNAYPFRK